MPPSTCSIEPSPTGATVTPVEDKALTQARRAVEKAATLLESLPSSAADRRAWRRAVEHG